jgi:hypothetical protein
VEINDHPLSGCPEEDRRGDRHLSGTRQRLCVDIYHVMYYVMNDTDNPSQSQPSMSEGGGAFEKEYTWVCRTVSLSSITIFVAYISVVNVSTISGPMEL